VTSTDECTSSRLPALGTSPDLGTSPRDRDHDPLGGYGIARARLGSPRRLLRIGGLVVGTVVVGTVVVGAWIGQGSPPKAVRSADAAPNATTGSPKLTWAPPTLTNPITLAVTPGHASLTLEPGLDYTVTLPRTPVDLPGGVSISGGHNVVIIGGVIQVPAKGEAPAPKQRRGLYLKGQTGTVHVEGVRMTGDLSEGFNLDQREGAVIQIENVQVDLVHGSHDGHHADVIQTWAGPRVLRVDGLRAATRYQGFFLLPNQWWKQAGPPEAFVFRRTVLTMMPGSAYAVWLPERNPSWLDFSGITVRLDGRAATGKLSWPNSSLGLKVAAAGTAADLPAGMPGGSYTSPGYAQKAGY